MYLKCALVIAALCIAGGPSGVTLAVAQDEVFVAQDGLNTGSIGSYEVSFGSGSASGSPVDASLITTPPAGASTEVRMSLATDGLGDLFVGEWASGTTATVGVYSLNGSPINSSLLTLSDSSGVPQLAADAEGQLFLSVGNTVYEYTTGGTLLNSFSVGPIAEAVKISALAVDNSGNIYTAYTTGNEALGNNPYHGVIGEYSASGSPINKSLITTPNFINSLAVGSGNIFVSIQDGPPDIENRVDEYNSDGSLAVSGLISGVGGHLALDGQGNLMVDSYGDGTVGAYTASGVLLNSDVISGAGGAEDILAIPVPEPSALELLAVGALGLSVFGGFRGAARSER